MPDYVVQTIAPITDLTRTKATATVQVRTRWVLPWTTVPDLLCQNVQYAANAIGRATLRYHYGRIQKKAAGQITTVPPIDIMGQWCRVSVTPYSGSTFYWYGFVAQEQRTHLGTETQSAVIQGDQIWSAFDPGYLLSRFQMSTSYIWSDFARYKINRPLNFNEFRTDELGNESIQGNKHPTQLGFAENLKTAKKWTARDIVDYLLLNHVKSAFAAEESLIDPQWGPGWFSDIDDGFNFTPNTIRTEGQTIIDILNQLFNRRRGTFWYIEPLGEIGFVVKVNSLASDYVLDPGERVVIAPNVDRIAVDLVGSRDANPVVQVVDSTTQYDAVKVVGGKQGAVFTVRVGDGNTLQKDWTATDESLYFKARSTDANYNILDESERATINDQYRNSEELRHVYTRYAIVDNWDGKTQPSVGDIRRFVFPDIDSAVDFNQNLSAIQQSRNIWRQGMRFLPYLPLKERHDYSGGTEEPIDKNPSKSLAGRIAPMVFAKVPKQVSLDTWDGVNLSRYAQLDTSSTYRHKDDLAGEAGSSLVVRFVPNEHQLGFWLLPNSVPHVMQEVYDFWTDVPGSVGVSHVEFGEVSRGELRATVYAQCDHEISYTYPEQFAANGRDDRQVLVLRFGDKYRVDWLLSDTWLGVLDTPAGSNPVKCIKDMMLRDDRRELQWLAFVAWVWYSTPRHAIEMSMKVVRGEFRIGQMIERLQVAEPNRLLTTDNDYLLFADGSEWIVDDSTNEKVNSVITNLDYDLERGATRIRTQFWDFDAEEVSRRIANNVI